MFNFRFTSTLGSPCGERVTVVSRTCAFFDVNSLTVMCFQQEMDSRQKKQRIELMKDVFTLIHPELLSNKNPHGKEHHENRKQRVEAWLEDIIETTSHDEYPWRREEKGEDMFNLLPQFMQLLRQCILTHQWTEVLSMLNCISHIPYGADWIIWKAALAAMYTEPDHNVNLIQDLFRHAYLLKELNMRDIALEFVQYLISQGLTEKASEVIKASRKIRKGVLNAKQCDLTQHLMNLLDAYQGMIFYMEWKAALRDNSKPSQNTQSQSLYSMTSSQGHNEDTIRRFANQALVGLDDLPKKAGVWDIFLTKSVEIHEYYQEFDDARELLCMYRSKNIDNPNSHRFLYEYLTRNCQHFDEALVSEESLSCLKSLAKLDPANPLVLTLWQKMTDEGYTGEALTYIFDLLDYVIWQDKAKGWECLVKSMGSGLSKDRSLDEKKSFLSALDKCWSTRKDWWPAYHFTGSVLTNDDHSCDQLLIAKAIVASVLLGEGHSFCTAARNTLTASSCQRLDDALSNVDCDTMNQVGFFDISSECLQGACWRKPYMKLYSGFSSSDSDSDSANASKRASSKRKKRVTRTKDKQDPLDQSCASTKTPEQNSCTSKRSKSQVKSTKTKMNGQPCERLDTLQVGSSTPNGSNKQLEDTRGKNTEAEKRKSSETETSGFVHSCAGPNISQLELSGQTTKRNSLLRSLESLKDTQKSIPAADDSVLQELEKQTMSSDGLDTSSRSASTLSDSDVDTSSCSSSTLSKMMCLRLSRSSSTLSKPKADETGGEKKRCKTSGDISSLKQTGGKALYAESSKQCQKVSEQKTFQNITMGSSQKPKSKRKIEEVDDVMFIPLKRIKIQK